MHRTTKFLSRIGNFNSYFEKAQMGYLLMYNIEKIQVLMYASIIRGNYIQRKKRATTRKLTVFLFLGQLTDHKSCSVDLHACSASFSLTLIQAGQLPRPLLLPSQSFFCTLNTGCYSILFAKPLYVTKQHSHTYLHATVSDYMCNLSHMYIYFPIYAYNTFMHIYIYICIRIYHFEEREKRVLKHIFLTHFCYHHTKQLNIRIISINYTGHTVQS